ncbi:hypothetical protein D3C73_1268220 [compost metagenome]
MVYTAVQYLLQLLLRQIIFTEGQTVEAFITLPVRQIQLIAERGCAQQIFPRSIGMILDKPLQADSHFRKLGIVLRLDFGLIIQIGYKKAEKAAHNDH